MEEEGNGHVMLEGCDVDALVELEGVSAGGQGLSSTAHLASKPAAPVSPSVRNRTCRKPVIVAYCKFVTDRSPERLTMSSDEVQAASRQRETSSTSAPSSVSNIVKERLMKGGPEMSHSHARSLS